MTSFHKLINCTFVLHPKSWTQDWRCSFFMSKLTREDKIEIYERNKNVHISAKFSY